MHVIVGLLHYNFLCYVTCKFGVANVAWLVTPNLYNIMFKSSGIIYCVGILIPVYRLLFWILSVGTASPKEAAVFLGSETR